MREISIALAFIAGLGSFLSPCVLPIIPGFISYLAGTSISQPALKRKETFFTSLFFVLGFSLVFAILGVVLNTVLQRLAYNVLVWVSRIGGVLIIFFGLYLIGSVKIPFLEKEHKITVRKKFNSRYLTAFVFGTVFAAGWTPCVGPSLGAIIGLATQRPSLTFYLLLTYAVGFSFPFILVGIFIAEAAKFINKYARFFKYVNIVFGIVLIILGVLIFTRNLALISNFTFLRA